MFGGEPSSFAQVCASAGGGSVIDYRVISRIRQYSVIGFLNQLGLGPRFELGSLALLIAGLLRTALDGGIRHYSVTSFLDQS